MQKSFRVERDAFAGLPNVHIQGGQFKKADVALFDGLLFQHFAGDADKAQVNAGKRGLLLGGFVEFKGEVPA